MSNENNNNNNNNNNINLLEQHEHGWERLEGSKGPAPFARNGHKMVVYKDNLYVYGGNNQQEDQTGQIHMYTPETKTWHAMMRDGPGRTLHSAIVHKDSLIVFGGTGSQEVRSMFRGVTYTPTLFNETWSFHFGTQQWSKIQTSGAFPLPRDGHTAVVHNDVMYVFGGSDNSTVFCDLYSLHLGRDNKGVWMKARSEGTIPSPRRLHSCVVYDDCIWIFGGYDGRTFFDDVFVYNIATGIWSIPKTSGEVPLKRYGHTAVVYNDYMYIFGGYGAASGFRNDLYHFHLPTCTWTQVTATPKPPARRGHASVVYNDCLFVFGGSVSSTAYSDEMWLYKFKEIKVEEINNPLVEDLQKMLDSPLYYPDVVLKVGSRTIKAHKCILSARCSYFDSVFKSGFQEANTNEVTISDIGEEAFLVFLRYLYGGPTSLITPEVSFELLTIAEKYMLPHLKWECEGIVLEGIIVENVVALLITSDTYKCERLHKACLDFIGKHHHLVVKSEEFKTLPTTLLLEVTSVISATK